MGTITAYFFLDPISFVGFFAGSLWSQGLSKVQQKYFRIWEKGKQKDRQGPGQVWLYRREVKAAVWV